MTRYDFEGTAMIGPCETPNRFRLPERDLAPRWRGREASSAWWFLVGALWLIIVTAGLGRLANYASIPGASGPRPEHWPNDTTCVPEPARSNLVLFVHPHCPCTQATLSELERLTARCHGSVAIHVLFYAPRAFPANWEKTDLWRRAEAIPGAHVCSDPDGGQARLFGATTSGHAFLYHQDGRLLFHGGITRARGHEGANAGADAIVSLLTQDAPEQRETPVFGCPLMDRPSPERSGD